MKDSQLAINLAKLRKDRKLTQSKLAELAGVTTDTIQSIEYEKTTDPSVKTLIGLATALEVSVDMLVGHPSDERERSELIIRIIAALPSLDEAKLRAIFNTIGLSESALNISSRRSSNP